MGGSCGDMRRAARVAARAAILIWRHGQQAAVRVYLGPHTNKPRAAAHWLLFDGDRRGVSVGLTPINGSAPCVSRRHGPAGPRARHRIPRECPARLRGARQGRHGLPARLVRARRWGGTGRRAMPRSGGAVDMVVKIQVSNHLLCSAARLCRGAATQSRGACSTAAWLKDRHRGRGSAAQREKALRRKRKMAPEGLRQTRSSSVR